MMVEAAATNLGTGDDRIVVIGEGMEPGPVLDVVRARYGDWTVASCDTYLSGIAEVGRRRSRAVLAGVNPSLTRLPEAMAGLREAAGGDTRLVLVCPPHHEPTARRLLDHGADDYVLFPLQGAELDKSLGVVRDEPPAARVDASVSLADVARITALLSGISAEGSAILRRAAEVVHSALPCAGARVTLQGSVGAAGAVFDKPVLTAALREGDATIGQITLGAPEGRGYASQDVDKLEHLASLLTAVFAARTHQHKWRRLAHTDDLSGLPNRRYFNERLDEILRQAAELRLPVTVLIFDVDDFKTFNDVCGHDAGDDIIRVTARLIREHCREQDLACRIGGDEFAVVFWDAEGPRVPGSKHPESALALLERFQTALRAEAHPTLTACKKAHLSVSGGLASYPWDGSTRAELLRRADEALLAAKRAGKDRIHLIGAQG